MPPSDASHPADPAGVPPAPASVPPLDARIDPPPAEPPAAPPPMAAPPPPSPPPPPGLREQARRTIAAARRLFTAHVSLAKAEGGVILDDVKRVAGLLGVAVAALAFLGLLLPVGLTLFVGEAVFGSMGWGILHGTLLSIAIAVVMGLTALRITRGYLVGTLAIAIVLGIVVGVVLGLHWPNQGYARLGESIVPGIDAGIRPLVAGLAVGAVVFALLGLLAGARAGGGSGAIGGLLAGAIVGLLVGAFTAITFSGRAAAALGVATALVAWPILAALALRGYDWEELKRRFVPQASIDAAKETMEFVKTRMPGRKGDEA